MSEQDDLDECYSQIQELISNAEAAKMKKAINADDKIKTALDAIYRYQGHLNSDESQNRFNQYKQQIKEIRQLGMTSDKKKQMDILEDVDDKVREKVGLIKKDIHEALTSGQRAMLELTQQIEALDQLHKVGNDNHTELKRIKNSLNTLLRGVMTDKCTCFLLILLLCGIIAVLVIYFVRRNQNKTV